MVLILQNSEVIGIFVCFLFQNYSGVTATNCVNDKYKAAYGRKFSVFGFGLIVCRIVFGLNNVADGNGILTFYSDSGVGACGANQQLGKDALYGKMFAAAPKLYWGGGNPNLDPICLDFCALVSYNGGDPIEVKIIDQCPECTERWLDLSPTAFSTVTGLPKDSILTLGKVYDATIKFQRCSKGPSGTGGWADGVSAAETCPNSDWTKKNGGKTKATSTGSSEEKTSAENSEEKTGSGEEKSEEKSNEESSDEENAN